VEHLREHWRQATASKRTLYRGISLQGASARFAWGLDQAIVRKFSSAMKKGDHQAAAKIVLDLCEQSGEFVEGGHFGVWWSTDLKVARGYGGMHTRETLGCVIHAEVEDDDINQGHAEQYGFTSEAPVVLRQGARIDIVAIEVRYNPDLKVLRDGDFVLIPVRRQVTATLKTADDLSVDGGDMRFYEWEGKQQKANGGGRKINSVRDATELGNRVLTDYGFDASKVTWSMGTWESWTKDEGGRIHINIGYGYSGDGAANSWTVLHEVAHAILFLRGNANHRHGADFEAMLMELLQRYTRVRNITPRTAATKTWREKVDALPESYTPAIMSAMENAYDMGLREEADDDGAAFWYQVYGEVMA